MVHLAKQPESQNTEWKQSWRDDYLAWICGFANAKGGKIFIGVDDTGEVVGVENSRRLLEDIPSKIQMALGIVCDVDLHSQDGLDYLEISVSPSSFPVSYRGQFHYRSGSTKRQLTGFALADFVMRRTDSHWDEAPVDSVSLDDVDQESIKIFKREALRSRRMTAEELDCSDEELLNKLGVLVDGKLTRAGVLLFTEKHFEAQTATYTKVGMFGDGRDELLYQDAFDGSLINTASKILGTIFLKYLRASISYDQGVRVETYPFEYDAVREGIYNALIHNVYMMGIPIQIRIDDHTMEISNSCILPEDWTVDSLMETHRSVPYNPSIANVFYRMGYIENWGRGVEKIVGACDRLGAPRPEYKVVGYDITLYLHALESAVIRDRKGSDETKDPSSEPLRDALNRQSTAKASVDDALNMTGDALDQVTGYSHEASVTAMPVGVYGLERKLIDLIRENGAMNQLQMAEVLGTSRSSIQRGLKRLVDAGVVQRIGGKKMGQWVTFDAGTHPWT